ncbi:MAG: DUF1292 domain-containing protein [Firmicutes bacterium]|nr:DUF1292 domain-containing protein [Bacillota bacterium]
MTEEGMDDTIVLKDEDGEEHEFSVVDVIEVDGKEYAILLPMDHELDQGADIEDIEEGAVIFRVESDGKGEEVLVEIDDDDEWERVAGAWEEIIEDEEDEDDEDDED